GADVEIGMLPRQNIIWGFPTRQVWSNPLTLERMTSHPRPYAVPQEVEKRSRPPPWCRKHSRRVCSQEIVLFINGASRSSFSHMWHGSRPTHSVSGATKGSSQIAVTRISAIVRIQNNIRQRRCAAAHLYKVSAMGGEK